MCGFLSLQKSKKKKKNIGHFSCRSLSSDLSSQDLPCPPWRSRFAFASAACRAFAPSLLETLTSTTLAWSTSAPCHVWRASIFPTRRSPIWAHCLAWRSVCAPWHCISSKDWRWAQLKCWASSASWMCCRSVGEGKLIFSICTDWLFWSTFNSKYFLVHLFLRTYIYCQKPCRITGR